jgi:alkyldihydroxyacetonephosphate synthase
MPSAEEITLRAPRVAVPSSLAAVSTTDKYERLFHSFGRSVHDLARMIHRRDFSNPPDVVTLRQTQGERSI